jgi:hypothetical protein
LSSGWSKESLKPGDHVTIEGIPAKDHPSVCKARAVRLASGLRLFMGLPGAVLLFGATTEDSRTAA